MARPMGARRAPSRRSYCGDKFALDWQHRHTLCLPEIVELRSHPIAWVVVGQASLSSGRSHGRLTGASGFPVSSRPVPKLFV